MEKVIKNGEVAILYSPGFGAGWYSWNTNLKGIIFHPKLVEWAESGVPKDVDLEEWCKNEFKTNYVCTLGWDQIKVFWLKEGSDFRIDEYDGFESVVTIDSLNLKA